MGNMTYSDEFKQICEMFLTGDKSNVELAYSLLSTLSIQERSVFIKFVIKEVGKMYVAKELLHKIVYPETPSSKYLIDKTIEAQLFRDKKHVYVDEYISPLIHGLEKTMTTLVMHDCADFIDFSNFHSLWDITMFGKYNRFIYKIPKIKWLKMDMKSIIDYDSGKLHVKTLWIDHSKLHLISDLIVWNDLSNIECEELYIHGHIRSNFADITYPNPLMINCEKLVLNGLVGDLNLDRIINKKDDSTITVDSEDCIIFGGDCTYGKYHSV